MDCKAWGKSSDMPFAFSEEQNGLAAEAVWQALEELFNRYPCRTEMAWYESGQPVSIDPIQARKNALDYARRRRTGAAILWADNTGVPREELISLALLLGAESREPDPDP